MIQKKILEFSGNLGKFHQIYRSLKRHRLDSTSGLFNEILYEFDGKK